MGVTLTHLKESRHLIPVQLMYNWKITIQYKYFLEDEEEEEADKAHLFKHLTTDC